MNDSPKEADNEKARSGVQPAAKSLATPTVAPTVTSAGRSTVVPAAKPETKPDNKVEPKIEAKAESKVESKPDPKPDSKFEPRLESKVEVAKRVEARIDSKPESKPEIKLDRKVDPEPEAPIVSESSFTQGKAALEPVQVADEQRDQGRWTRWLVWFLRAMAVLSMMKGLYHWSLVLGIGEGPDTTFTTQSLPWQSATVYFAIIDLVAAVGLWLAAVWGAVVWLTAGVSMAAVEVFFPQIYGGSWLIVAIELFLLCCYLVLALQSAREHPH